jgi:hypothetical protein
LLGFVVGKGLAARKNQLREKLRVNYFFVWVVIFKHKPSTAQPFTASRKMTVIRHIAKRR